MMEAFRTAGGGGVAPGRRRGPRGTHISYAVAVDSTHPCINTASKFSLPLSDSTLCMTTTTTKPFLTLFWQCAPPPPHTHTHCDMPYQGILYPLVEEEAPVALTTDMQGQFIVEEPLDGIYKFSSDLPGSRCIDALTGVPVTFPMIQQIPASMSATITAISLLSGPAKSDPAVREVVSLSVSGK